jgi:hypothetical protein
MVMSDLGPKRGRSRLESPAATMMPAENGRKAKPDLSAE